MDPEVPNEEAHPEKGPSEEVQLDFSSLFEENGAGLGFQNLLSGEGGGEGGEDSDDDEDSGCFSVDSGEFSSIAFSRGSVEEDDVWMRDGDDSDTNEGEDPNKPGGVEGVGEPGDVEGDSEPLNVEEGSEPSEAEGGAPVPPPPLPRAISKMTVPEFKTSLAHRGLDTSGKKAMLKERLKAYQNISIDAAKAITPDATVTTDVANAVTPASAVAATAIPVHLPGAGIPRGRSKAHAAIVAGKVVYLSFDIETGGENCGIIQMSGELIRLDLNGTSPGSDTASNIRRDAATFNEYVNPGEEAEWDEYGLGIHGLSPSDKRIVEAGDMTVVWNKFIAWISSNTTPDETLALVAWNGAACDMKWLWRITQAP